jgi:hypothetical protein
MIADFSTEPLQGSKFIEFRDRMQGIRAEDYADYKKQYITVLKTYDLYENEDNLDEL